MLETMGKVSEFVFGLIVVIGVCIAAIGGMYVWLSDKRKGIALITTGIVTVIVGIVVPLL